MLDAKARPRFGVGAASHGCCTLRSHSTDSFSATTVAAVAPAELCCGRLSERHFARVSELLGGHLQPQRRRNRVRRLH